MGFFFLICAEQDMPDTNKLKKTTIAFCHLHQAFGSPPGNPQEAAFMTEKQIFEDGFLTFRNLEGFLVKDSD